MSGYLNLSRASHNAAMKYRRGMPYSGRRRFSGNMRYRISRLEQQLYQIRPEKHYKTHVGAAISQIPNSITNINVTDIGQGDTQHERTGRKIKIHKVEIRLTANSSSSTFEEPLACFLLLGKDARAPTVSDFGGQLYPMVDIDEFTELMSFTTKQNHTTDSQTIRRVKYFKKPLVVEYETTVSTTAITNKLYFTLLNNGSSNSTVNYAVRVWFTD